MNHRQFAYIRLWAILFFSLFLSTRPVEAEKSQLAYYKAPTSAAPSPVTTTPQARPIRPESVAPVPSSPQQTQGQPLTLEQAIDLATQNNPGLQATRARLGVSEADIITAGARLNPSIVSDNGIAEKTYRVGIEQTFQLGGKRGKRIAIAKAQRDALMAEINTAVLDLRSDLRKAYIRFYNAQQRLQAFEEIAQTNEHLVTVAQKREKAGDIPNLDVLQAEISALRARNTARNAFNEIIQARTNFNMLIGQPLATLWVLASPSTLAPQAPPEKETLEPVPLRGNISLQQTDLESLVQEALINRPELKQGLAEMTVNERQLSLARASIIPDLTLAAGPDMVTDSSSKAFNAFIVGNLELPLFNRQQGPILQAHARRTQLGAQQNVLKNRVILEVTNAYTTFSLNQEQVKRYETDLLPRAERVVQMSQRSFEVGKSPILIPLNAQQAYQETRLEYLQALSDYQNAISDLERAVGTGL